MEKYLMKGTMAVVLCLGAMSCSHMGDNFDKEWVAQEYQDNFVKKVGEVNPNQDFNLFTTVKANISVNLGLADEYTVAVYMNNPYSSSEAGLLAAQTVKEGGKMSAEFTAEAVQTRFYVGAFDEQGRGFVKSVEVEEDGSLDVNLIEETTTKTRTLTSSFNFPKDADASKFVSDIPGNAEEMKSVGAGWHYGEDGVTIIYDYMRDAESGVYYIENTNDKINFYGDNQGNKLYIKGNCAPETFYVGKGAEVYLLPGATLTLKEGQAGSEKFMDDTKFYIAEGAALQTTGTIKLNTSNSIYNHGTIKAANLEVNGGSIFYNKGKLELSGKLSSVNEQAAIVNDGDITGAEVSIEGSAHFQNNGTTTISGLTEISSNQNSWVNNGTYTTGNFNYVGGSTNVINNCKLYVNDKFRMAVGTGEFKIDAGGSVITKYFELVGGSPTIRMGAKAMIKVTETATVGIGNSGWGIYGPDCGCDYAVFQAKNVVKNDGNQRYEITYGGKLIVDSDNHFAQGYDSDQKDGPYIGIGDCVIIPSFSGEATAFNSFPASECSPGYEGRNGSKKLDPVYYTIAFEDLGSTDDFDFNDAVLEITWYSNNGEYSNEPGVQKAANTADVKLVAAGGTLPITISYNGNPLFVKSDGIMKTGRGNYGEAKGISFTSANSDLGKFTLTVHDGESSTIISSSNVKGTAPQALVIPNKWAWPTERTNIIDAYSSFANWIQGSSAIDWYTKPTGNVVK